ncbi:CDP-alcohol phosphatidyltransferase family protein [Tateyamaria sp. SN6-1]|uniref:CDP-alcohol phosphatidyltransferase family protein n=1 Tax=Tateyamaria sp. SN6-1 TaxID=3092148 RepID=UPI0039F569BD
MEGWAPVSVFLAVSAVLCAALVVASLLAFGSPAIPIVFFVTVVVIATYGLVQGYPHPELGLCNVVTLSRAAMVAFLLGAVFFPMTSAWVVCAVAIVAFALDGVDGWFARRTGRVSDFGARFDMETDAALGAVISLWLFNSGVTGPEVLAIGFMRYAFFAASFVWPALQAPLPEAFRRKAICVVQIAALIILVFPLTPDVVVMPTVIGAALLLGWSFLIDILWLMRRAG